MKSLPSTNFPSSLFHGWMTLLIFVNSRPEEGDSQWGHTQAGAARLVLAAQTEDRDIHSEDKQTLPHCEHVIIHPDRELLLKVMLYTSRESDILSNTIKTMRSSVKYWWITAHKSDWDTIRIAFVMTGHVKHESGLSLLSRLVTRPRVDTCLGPGLGPLTSPYTCLSVTGEGRRYVTTWG